MKNEKMKWYFLIAAALVVGAMVGYFATNSLSTTGNAKATISERGATAYEKYAFGEMEQYIKQNNLTESNVLIYRKSTKGKEIPSANISHYDLKQYTYVFNKNELLLINKATGETTTIYAQDCDTSTTSTVSPGGITSTVNWHYSVLFDDKGWWGIVY